MFLSCSIQESSDQIPMRHKHATINESFRVCEFMYIHDRCSARGEESVNFKKTRRT